MIPSDTNPLTFLVVTTVPSVKTNPGLATITKAFFSIFFAVDKIVSIESRPV
jgi:hypothetical protein